MSAIIPGPNAGPGPGPEDAEKLSIFAQVLKLLFLNWLKLNKEDLDAKQNEQLNSAANSYLPNSQTNPNADIKNSAQNFLAQLQQFASNLNAPSQQIDALPSMLQNSSLGSDQKQLQAKVQEAHQTFEDKHKLNKDEALLATAYLVQTNQLDGYAEQTMRTVATAVSDVTAQAKADGKEPTVDAVGAGVSKLQAELQADDQKMALHEKDTAKLQESLVKDNGLTDEQAAYATEYAARDVGLDNVTDKYADQLAASVKAEFTSAAAEGRDPTFNNISESMQESAVTKDVQEHAKEDEPDAAKDRDTTGKKIEEAGDNTHVLASEIDKPDPKPAPEPAPEPAPSTRSSPSPSPGGP